MDLLLTDDQQQIVDSVRDVLHHEFSRERLRSRSGPYADGARALWGRIAELGWLGLGLPEDAGGMGLGLGDEALLFRELGRHLVTPGLLACGLAARVAHAAGAPEVAAQLAAGRQRAALVIAIEPLAQGCEAPVYLVDGTGCEWAVAWNAEGAWLLERTAIARLSPVASLVEGVPMERGTLDVAQARMSVHAAACADTDVLMAAYLCGIAEATRDMAVDYVKIREQFGRPIGSFQAIKHRCADMAVGCEAAWCQTVMASLLASGGDTGAAVGVAAARWLAQRAAEENAAANIQLHGAMGFTAECEAHHFLKHALLISHLGEPGAVRRALLQ
jgi:alkylation response protein AidB-like acyl-CoA dehydrogenase